MSAGSGGQGGKSASETRSGHHPDGRSHRFSRMFLATHSAGGGRSAMSDSNLEDLAGPKRVRTRNAVGGGRKRSGPMLLDSKSGGQKIYYPRRSEEHTSELQSLMRIPSAVFGLNK